MVSGRHKHRTLAIGVPFLSAWGGAWQTQAATAAVEPIPRFQCDGDGTNLVIPGTIPLKQAEFSTGDGKMLQATTCIPDPMDLGQMSAPGIAKQPRPLVMTLIKRRSDIRAAPANIGTDRPPTLRFKGVAPVMVSPASAITDRERITLFSVSEGNRFANEYRDRSQRLFTWHVVDALLDGIRDLGSLATGVREGVAQASRARGPLYEQTLAMHGKLEGRIRSAHFGQTPLPGSHRNTCCHYVVGRERINSTLRGLAPGKPRVHA